MKIQESTAFATAMKMEASGAFAVVRELQKTLEAVRAPLNGASAMLEEYHKTLAPALSIKVCKFFKKLDN